MLLEQILAQILAQLSEGDYLLAMTLGLVALTSAVRWGGADAALYWLARSIPGDDGLQVHHLRAWIPLVLAAIAWAVAVISPLDVSTREAADAALITAITAIAGHDVARAVRTLQQVVSRALPRARQRNHPPPPPPDKE